MIKDLHQFRAMDRGYRGQSCAFLVALLGCLALPFLHQPLYVIKAELMARLQLTRQEGQWLHLAFLLPQAVVQMILSVLIGSSISQYIIPCSLVLASIPLIVLGTWHNVVWVHFTLALSGLFLALVWPASLHILSMWFPKKSWNHILSSLRSLALSGALICGPLAFYTQELYGWERTFIPVGFLTIAGAHVLLVLQRKPQVNAKPTMERVPNSGNCLVPLWQEPGIIGISFAALCLRFLETSMITWLPLYMIEEQAFPRKHGWVLKVIFMVSAVASGPIFGTGLRKYGPLPVLRFIFQALMVDLVIFLVFALTRNLLDPIYCSMILTVTTLGISGPLSLVLGPIPMTLVERSGNTLGAISFTNGVSLLGVILSEYLVELVLHYQGWHGVLGLLLLVNLFAVLAMGVILGSVRKNELEKSPSQAVLLTDPN